MLEGRFMLKVRRVLSVVCLLLFLGLPLAAAQAEREPVSPFARFLDAFLERLAPITAPFAALWQADGAEDPDPGPQPGTGLIWDPNG
jgi:hypothetical protein